MDAPNDRPLTEPEKRIQDAAVAIGKHFDQLGVECETELAAAIALATAAKLKCLPTIQQLGTMRFYTSVTESVYYSLRTAAAEQG
ncbi:hypothetical protein U8335_03860 [Roseiconus lacunae]|uniref:Uncharacterized protein n=1 Tax=Roseiconus lacunae TaxID=2605694 RepID=A0ABT7PIH4_9BACT|nr:hypothetical protein [Roseiconus lacunae]MDM4015991.1 hypothetical protein [Roseiconus lacunae]WRQ51677.1 hypothetical protein U8335_03860 [Stieleria sp. HD01]